jgi:hypothetical protein
MKAILTFLLVTVAATGAAFANCKDCGCKTKCSTACKCQHDKKTP